jgi:ribosomal protein S7
MSPVAEIKPAVSKLPQRKKLALVQWLHTQGDDRLNDEEMMTLSAEVARALDKREAAYAKRKAR